VVDPEIYLAPLQILGQHQANHTYLAQRLTMSGELKFVWLDRLHMVCGSCPDVCHARKSTAGRRCWFDTPFGAAEATFAPPISTCRWHYTSIWPNLLFETGLPTLLASTAADARLAEVWIQA
jgi:hypothetical protein